MSQDIAALRQFVVQEVQADSDGVPLNEQAIENVVQYYNALGVRPIDIINSRHLGNPNHIWELYHFALVMIVGDGTIGCPHVQFSNGTCGQCQREQRRRHRHAVRNSISGEVSGTVVQSETTGPINF
jgi:hypothetical protein